MDTAAFPALREHGCAGPPAALPPLGASRNRLAFFAAVLRRSAAAKAPGPAPRLLSNGRPGADVTSPSAARRPPFTCRDPSCIGTPVPKTYRIDVLISSGVL